MTTFDPTLEPTLEPIYDDDPTLEPTLEPTINPVADATTSANPTTNPTLNPSVDPTLNPTKIPTLYPSFVPTSAPSKEQQAAASTDTNLIIFLGVGAFAIVAILAAIVCFIKRRRSKLFENNYHLNVMPTIGDGDGGGGGGPTSSTGNRIGSIHVMDVSGSTHVMQVSGSHGLDLAYMQVEAEQDEATKRKKEPKKQKQQQLARPEKTKHTDKIGSVENTNSGTATKTVTYRKPSTYVPTAQILVGPAPDKERNPNYGVHDFLHRKQTIELGAMSRAQREQNKNLLQVQAAASARARGYTVPVNFDEDSDESSDDNIEDQQLKKRLKIMQMQALGAGTTGSQTPVTPEPDPGRDEEKMEFEMGNTGNTPGNFDTTVGNAMASGTGQAPMLMSKRMSNIVVNDNTNTVSAAFLGDDDQFNSDLQAVAEMTPGGPDPRLPTKEDAESEMVLDV